MLPAVPDETTLLNVLGKLSGRQSDVFIKLKVLEDEFKVHPGTFDYHVRSLHRTGLLMHVRSARHVRLTPQGVAALD